MNLILQDHINHVNKHLFYENIVFNVESHWYTKNTDISEYFDPYAIIYLLVYKFCIMMICLRISLFVPIVTVSD